MIIYFYISTISVNTILNVMHDIRQVHWHFVHRHTFSSLLSIHFKSKWIMLKVFSFQMHLSSYRLCSFKKHVLDEEFKIFFTSHWSIHKFLFGFVFNKPHQIRLIKGWHFPSTILRFVVFHVILVRNHFIKITSNHCIHFLL